MNGTENLVFTENSILIKETMDLGEAVMHMGEKPLMEYLARLVSKNGGHILEVGFGLHLSADEIQLNKNVKSHTIIEIHPEIYQKALEWSKNKPNVKIILGDWVDVIPTITDKFDGILHDTHRDRNIPKFLDMVSSVCNTGCIVGFFECKVFDNRMTGIRFKINEDEYQSLPYKNNLDFSNNQYELKYSIFDGVKFGNNVKQNKLL